MAYALRQNGSNVGSALIATGAVAGMIAVILIMMYGQSRVLFVISRDGLISDKFSKIHKKFGLKVRFKKYSKYDNYSFKTPVEKIGNAYLLQ